MKTPRPLLSSSPALFVPVVAVIVLALAVLAVACAAPADTSTSRHCSGYDVHSTVCHGYAPHPKYTLAVPTAGVTKRPGVTPRPVPTYTQKQRVAPKLPAAPRLSLRKK